MAITTTLAPTVEDALITALQARNGLDGVQVSQGPLGDESDADEYIQTGVGDGGGVSSSENWSTLGNLRRREQTEIQGEIFVRKSSAGVTTIKAARDRANVLLDEVAAELREDPTIGGVCQRAELARWNEDRAMGSGWRISIIHFTVAYVGDLPSS